MNKKLSSFESISTSEINDSSVYVSAVLKLKDGSYKNINIPISQLSGLWNNDVQLAIANADFEGGAIDAEVIHLAALNAVENAIASAEAAIEEATNKANQLVNDYNTGNTQTQILIREAQERLDQQITSAIDKVSLIQTMYDQYFGVGGIVEQKASEANRALNQAQDALNDAQDLLDRLNNGEIVPTGIEDLSRKIDNLETLWGQKGTWVSEEDATNRIMTQFENYIDLLTASKNFTMTYANGSTGEVKKFTDFLNLMKGEYEKVLSKVDTVNQQYLEMGERWDEASETMKQFVTKTDLSDEINPVVDSAVRKTSSKLIEDAVYSATMQVVGELLFEQSTEVGTKKLVKIKDSQLYYNFLPDTSYYLRWDGNTDDDAVNIYYQFIIVDSNASFNSSNWALNTNYSEDNWNLLTNDAIRSIGEPTTTVDPNSQQTVEVPDTRTRYLALKYTGYSESGSKILSKQCKVTAQIEKYMSAAQLQISAKEAVLSAFENDPGIRQRLAQLTVGADKISQAVIDYFNDNEFDAAGIKNTADQVSTYVLEYLKNSDGTYKTLESEINSTKEAIEQTVIDASLTSKAIWNKTKASEYNLTVNYSIDQSGAKANLSKLVKHYELETGHEYILKGRDLDVLFYTLSTNNLSFNDNSTVFDQNSTYEWSNNPFGNWVKAENPNSIKIVIPNVGGNSNSKILSFYIKVKKVKGNSNNLVYLDNPEVEIFETVNSKMGNFKVSANAITETLFDTEAVDENGENVITKIYNRLATADGVQTTIGQVASGFVNQSTFNNKVGELESSITSMGGTIQGNQFVKQSDFDQKVDEIKLNVSEVGYVALENALCSVNYSNGSYVDGEYQSGKSYTLQDSGYQGNRYYYLNLENETGAAIILCKVKLINPNTDHLLFVNNADKYTIAKMWLFTSNGNNFNSAYGDSIMTVWYDPLSNDENIKKLRPFKSESSGISYAYIVLMLNKVQKTPVLASKTDLNGTPLNLKVGIPTDVAVSNIKQTADDIQLQVSSQEKIYNNDGSLTTKLQTAVQDITDSRITNTVAETINGKLTGYSTIEQTKDFIASTVGAAGVVTNKFNDPLFKHEYGYWHKRYNNYPNYIDFTTLLTNQNGSITKKFSNPESVSYQLSTSSPVNNKFEKDLKSFIMFDRNPSMISGLEEEKRRHIYGMYTRPKVTTGEKYTASFYIKLASGDYLKSMLNVGLCAELAKQASTFHIACIDTAWTFEQAENKTYDSSHDIKVENLNSFNFNNLLSSPTSYRLEIENQGNTTGNGFKTVNGKLVADDDQFGLWLKFNTDYLGTYMTKIFEASAPIGQGPTINGSTPTYRWFKVWFTFTAQDKYIDTVNRKDVFINYTKDSSRAFCFEPWVNQPATNNFHPLFCEIAAPMLNAGTTPLKFSSQEKSDEVYSVISQTKNAIDLSINNVRQGLEKVGITIDAEHPEESKIELSADVLKANLNKATFTGDIEAKSFKVQPQGSDSSISLVIYNPSDTSFVHKYITDNNTKLKISPGTPVLVSTVGEDVYLINLTKMNNNGEITYYFKIRTDIPIIIKNIGYSEEFGNTISGFKIKPVKYFLNNVYNIYLEKYVAESIVDTLRNTITLGNVASNSFYNTLNCSEFTFKYSTNEGDKSLTFDGDDEPYIRSTGVLKYKSVNLKQVAQNIRGISYFSINSPVFSLDYSRGGDIYGMPIYRHNFSQPGNSAYDSAGNLHVINEGSLRMFKVYKNINSSGTLIDLTHFENNKRSEDKYCYAIESKDRTTGEIFYQILGFYDIARYFGDLTNNNRYYNDVYDVEQGNGSKCFEIAEAIINNCFVIGCPISKNLNENTLTGDNSSYRVFFNEDECNKLNERLSRGYAQAVGKAQLSSGKKIISD